MRGDRLDESNPDGQLPDAACSGWVDHPDKARIEALFVLAGLGLGIQATDVVTTPVWIDLSEVAAMDALGEPQSGLTHVEIVMKDSTVVSAGWTEAFCAAVTSALSGDPHDSSSSHMASAAPPGMYQDPDDPAQHRWWDGVQWTNHRPQPVAVAAPVPDLPANAGYAYKERIRAQQAATVAPAPVSQVSGLAVVALVAGLLTVWIVAIPCGHMALYNIKHSGGTQRGNPMAVAGTLLGWLWLNICIVAILLMVGLWN